MSQNRRLRRLAEKKATKARRQARIQGQTVNLNELSPDAAAMASFREAAEYQQMVSEILQHATSTFEGLDEENEHFEYFKDTVEALTAHYLDVKRFVSERGVEALTAADCTVPEPLIEVPELITS